MSFYSLLNIWYKTFQTLFWHLVGKSRFHMQHVLGSVYTNMKMWHCPLPVSVLFSSHNGLCAQCDNCLLNWKKLSLQSMCVYVVQRNYWRHFMWTWTCLFSIVLWQHYVARSLAALGSCTCMQENSAWDFMVFWIYCALTFYIVVINVLFNFSESYVHLLERRRMVQMMLN